MLYWGNDSSAKSMACNVNTAVRFEVWVSQFGQIRLQSQI